MVGHEKSWKIIIIDGKLIIAVIKAKIRLKII